MVTPCPEMTCESLNACINVRPSSLANFTACSYASVKDSTRKHIHTDIQIMDMERTDTAEKGGRQMAIQIIHQSII